jgi:hypothetical protein
MPKPIQQRAIRILIHRINDWAKTRLQKAQQEYETLVDSANSQERMLTSKELSLYGLKVFAVTERSGWHDPNRCRFVVKTVRNKEAFENASRDFSLVFPPIPDKSYKRVYCSVSRFGLSNIDCIACLESDLDTLETALLYIDNAILTGDAATTALNIDLMLFSEHGETPRG